MSYNLDKKMVIGVSSRALFDLTVENEKKSHINDCKIKDVAVFSMMPLAMLRGLPKEKAMRLSQGKL